MKQIFAIVLSVIFTVAHSQIKSDTSIVGSVFTGISKDSYRCLLKVNSDGTVCFAYSLRLNEVYSEYKGSIKKLNDTLYHVSVVMNFGQFPQMRLYTRDTIPPYTLHDTDYVNIPNSFLMGSDTTRIIYSNGKKELYLPSNNSRAFTLNKRLFNKRSSCNSYTMLFKRKDDITGQFLAINVRFGSEPSFESGVREEFDVVIKKGKLWTTGQPPMQTRDFRLSRK